MKKLFIFANEHYEIDYLDIKYYVNPNINAILTNVADEDMAQIKCESSHKTLTIYFNNLYSCNQYSVHELNGQTFLFLHFANFDNLIKKINNPCEILIYDTSIRIICNELCFCKTYLGTKNTFAVEKDSNIYIFNDKNITIFNKDNKTFLTLEIIEYKKTSENTEILCKIPKINGYFLLFNFSRDKLLGIKKLKKETPYAPPECLPYLIFYLCKFNFDECKNYISDNIELPALEKYFSEFDNLIEIEKRYYIFSQQTISPINFEIIDNKVVNID